MLEDGSDNRSNSSASFTSEEEGLALLDLDEPEDVDVDEDDLMELDDLASFNQAQHSSGELHLFKLSSVL